jgi:hypothetical protein|tara:strand:+ start:540 stop:1004 length:465 start_codon:yes stop_codon:yes gene_type:complete
MLITEKHITARNAVNARADLIESMLRESMRPLIGRKVWKVSGHGGQAAALSRAVESVCEAERLNRDGSRWFLIVHSDVHWICADLYVWQEGSGRTVETMFLGRRDSDGMLTDVDEQPGQRPQFTLQQVKSARARAYELESEARKLRSSVACFER